MNGCTQQDGNGVADLCIQKEEGRKLIGISAVPMNFDIGSYQFDDLDLKIAADRLSHRDRNILILRLMGHTQRDIARTTGGVTRSMISKRLRIIMGKLARHL